MRTLHSFTFLPPPLQGFSQRFSKRFSLEFGMERQFLNEIFHLLDIWCSGAGGGGGKGERQREMEEEEEEEEVDHLELPSLNVGICCNIPGGIFCHQLNSCCRIPPRLTEETGVVRISPHPITCHYPILLQNTTFTEILQEARKNPMI